MNLIDKIIKDENDLIALALVTKHIKYLLPIILVAALFMCGCSPWDIIRHWG